jgi:hypothetical protein
LLDFCRCSNQKCCAAPRELCAKVSKLQWLAPTLLTTVACTPRRPKRKLRNYPVLTLRFCQVDGFRSRNRCGSQRRLRPRLERLASAVIPREGGVSSTPQLLDGLRTSLEYWITRPSAQLRTRRVMTGPVRIVATRPFGAGRCWPGCPSRPGSPAALQNSV